MTERPMTEANDSWDYVPAQADPVVWIAGSMFIEPVLGEVWTDGAEVNVRYADAVTNTVSDWLEFGYRFAKAVVSPCPPIPTKPVSSQSDAAGESE